MRTRRTFRAVLCIPIALFALVGCRSATPRAISPQLTAAKVVPRIEKVLVAERGNVAMATRGGCVATIVSAHDETGSRDELGIRCPKKERMKSWFESIDRLGASLALEKVDEDEDDDDESGYPAAQIVMANGTLMRVKSTNDAARLVTEVRALTAELAAAEMPSPGPASPNGWQMLHVSGAAHIVFAGAPARGLLDAKMSTNGQYFCAFDTNTEEGPMHATKSGFIDEKTATKAIDEVMRPFQTQGNEDRPRASFVAGTTKGTEQRADLASTPAILERFSHVQDALGDACLPVVEPPQGTKTDL